MSFDTPIINWVGLVPVLIVLGAAVLGILIEAFVAPPLRRTVQVILAVGATLAAAAYAVFQWIGLEGDGISVIANRLVSDRQSLLWQVMIAIFAALGMLLFASKTADEDAFTPLASSAPGSADEAEATKRGFFVSEVFPLGLFAAGGMMLFPMVTDAIVLFIVLELFSLPLYVLVGLARRRRFLSQEAALKYFLTGAFASAIYLFGVALVYGVSATTKYWGIDLGYVILYGRDDLLLIGVVMMLVGLLFKLGAVPFHAWTPDAYQGAPTPVTAFMAAATKAAAAAALLRFLFGAVYRLEWELAPILSGIAIITMFLGAIVAIVQTDIKRMLAYSSIAHAGFLVVAFTSFDPSALSAVPFYMLAYGLASLGAFAVMSQVREVTADGSLGGEASRLGQWAGLGRRSPLLATAMALFLLSFAGIPLTAGFIGKFVVFKSAVGAGGWSLVVVAIVASAIAAFFYIRLIVLMFLTPIPGDMEDAIVVTAATGPVFVATITAVITVVLGVFPQPVLALARDAAILVP